MLGNPFGLGLQSLPVDTQRDLLRRQLLACGIDINTWSPAYQQIVSKVENPNARTIQLLLRLLGRLTALKELRSAKNPDFITFVFSRAPTSEQAAQMQNMCDQQALNAGPEVVQKLNRIKRLAPEKNRTQYYTEMLVGFEGLQKRTQQQAAFFENFSASLADLSKRQNQASQTFQENCIDRLHEIRKRQAQLRQRVITLVADLDELAVRAQGFEGDSQEVAQVEDEYARARRSLSELLNFQLETLKERASKLKPPTKDTLTPEQIKLENELFDVVARQHYQIENLAATIRALTTEATDSYIRQSL